MITRSRMMTAIGTALACSLGVFVISGPPHTADSVILQASGVVTMDGTSPTGAAPTSVFVHDGRILAVGSLDQVTAVSQGYTQVEHVNLGGNVIVPGFIEAHSHPMAAALLGQTINVSGFSHGSRFEMMEALREGLEKWSPLRWRVATGWDPIAVRDLAPPTRDELDELSPDRPLIILGQMLHDIYANSEALARANITAQTPDPPHGEFVRDSQGRLTGHLREVGAVDFMMNSVPRAPRTAVALLTNLTYAKYARAGYTTIVAMGLVGRAERPVELFEDLSKQARPAVRLIAYLLPSQADNRNSGPAYVNEFFHVRGVKFWMDGSPFVGGAAWAEPYENSALVREELGIEPGFLPPLGLERQEFEKSFETYHRQGYQIAVHVQGERAVQRVLDTAAAVLARHPRQNHRHRLEHAALITADQLQRASELGLTPSFFIDHVYYYGSRLNELIGPRQNRYMPVATALELGHHVSLHTDVPATPISALRPFSTAITRRERVQHTVIAASQAISAEQALRALTLDAAWQIGLEEELGSIEIGKRADFTILSADPRRIPSENLGSLSVRGTWIAGRPADTRPWTRANLAMALATVAEFVRLRVGL